MSGCGSVKVWGRTLVVVAVLATALATASVVAVVHAPPAGATSATGYWKLEEAGCATPCAAADSAGSHAGVFANNESHLGLGVTRDGASCLAACWIEVAAHDGTDTALMPDQITVDAWVQLNTHITATHGVIVSSIGNGWSLHTSNIYDGGGAIVGVGVTFDVGVWDGITPVDNFVSAAGSTNLRDGSWHHVAGTFDGTSTNLYVDGNLDHSTNVTGSLHHIDYRAAGGKGIAIGDLLQAFNGYSGLVDEVHLYSSAFDPLDDFNAADQSVLDSERNGGDNAAEGISSCSGSAADPVLLASGQFYENAGPDLVIPGRGPALAFTRSYNTSVRGQDAGLGYGWTGPYSMRASYNTALGGGAGGVDIVQENGAVASFASPYSGSDFYKPPRLFGSLHDNGVGTLTFTRRNQEVFTFNYPWYGNGYDGRLLSVADMDGNTTTMGYTGSRLTSVTEPGGRTFTIGWTGDNLHIASVADQFGRTVGYSYDTNGQLIGVTDVRGQTTSYEYETATPLSHRLTKVTDPRGHVVVFNHYDSAGRVDYQEDGVTYTTGHTGAHVTFAYGTDGAGRPTTTMTTPEGRVTVSTFARGQCVIKTVGAGSASPVTWSYTYDGALYALTSVAVNAGGTVSSPVTQHSWVYNPDGTVREDRDALYVSPTNDTNHEHAIVYGYPSGTANYRRPTTVTDRKGSAAVTTTLTYDSTHPWRLVTASTPIPAGTDGKTAAVTAYHYGESPDTHPDVTSVADPNHVSGSYPSESTAAQRTQLGYDSHGDVISVTDPSSGHGQTTLGYNDTGQRVWAVSPKGNATGTAVGVDAYRSATIYDNAGAPAVSVTAGGAPITDGFLRADSTSSLGAPETNDGAATKAWSAASGTWGITHDAAYLAAGSGASIAVISGSGTTGFTDGTVSFREPVAQTGLGVVFHRSATTGDYLSVRADTTGAWHLFKTVSGTTTELGSGTGASTCCTGTDRVAVTFSSTSPYPITVKINGTTKLSYSNTNLASLSTSTNTGVGLYAAATGTGRLDNFAAYGTASAEQSGTVDADGNTASAIDADGNQTTYTYDNANQLTQVNRANATTVQTAYDKDHNVYAQTNANGKVTNYRYNALEQVVSESSPAYNPDSPANNPQTRYTYNPTGTLAQKIDPAGTCTGTPTGCTTYTYGDARNLLTAVTYSDGVTPNVSSVHYDDNGQRTDMIDGTGKSCYSYDTARRLTSYTNGGGSTTSCTGSTVGYRYDAAANVTAIAYPGGSCTTTPTTLCVTRGFDDLNRLHTVTDFQATARTTTFDYDADSHLTTETNPNATTATTTFDAAGRVTDTKHDFTGTPAATLAEFAYTRDPAGQLTKTVTNPSSGSPTTNTYSYTSLNQVASDTSQTLTYDNSDNLATNTANWAQHYANSDDTQISTATWLGATRSYGYDTRGDRTTYTNAAGTTTTYNWNQAQQLTGVTGVTGYTYNADGLRMTKNVVTVITNFTYDIATGLPQPIAVGNGAGTGCSANSAYDYYLYSPDGTPFERLNIAITNGGTGSGCTGAATTTTANWFGHDQLGSTRLLTDNTGATVGTYKYDTYGNITSHTGTASTPIQYAGAWTDGAGEGGYIYLQHRFYDPITGQFASRDPLASTTRSPLGYAEGNPLNRTDPSGLAVVGVCVSVAGDMGGYGTLQSCTVSDGYAVAVVAGFAGGVGGLSISGQVSNFYSNAERVDQLSGVTACGGSGGGEVAVVGGEYCRGFKDDVNFEPTGIWSVLIGGGIGAGLPVDGHISVGRTGVHIMYQFRSYPGEEEHWDSWWNPWDEGHDC